MDARIALFDRFATLGIETRTQTHAPVFTVDDARRHTAHLPGGHCKSLFVTDRKGAMWLVVCGDDRRVDLKALGRRLGAASRLSFGRPELLREVLGVEPGAVTPFALINDVARQVRPVLDAAMLRHDLLNYHPLRNDATTTIGSRDLIRFIESCGHRPIVLDLEPAETP